MKDSNAQPQTTDYPVIYLEPGRGAPDTGRLWCQDDVWSDDPNYAEDGKPTKYVRADLYDALADKWEALLNQLGATDG
jgi:hypothetical protein